MDTYDLRDPNYKPIFFKDLKIHTLFVCKNNNLHVKCGTNQTFVLALEGGTPLFTRQYAWDLNSKIQRVVKEDFKFIF